MERTERWRDVVGYVGLYQVSDYGRVRSLDRVVPYSGGVPRRLRGKILALASSNRYGHLGVSLTKNGVGTTVRVHRIVAEAFLGPGPDGQQVRHGAAGHLDNSVSNLSYGTKSQDGYDKRRDGTHGGRPVRRNDGVEFINMHVAAEESGCDVRMVSSVCRGRRKTTGGYGWKYVDDPGPDTWEVSPHTARRIRRSDGSEFVSLSEAARAVDGKVTNICSVCNGRRKTAGGYGWEYVE